MGGNRKTQFAATMGATAVTCPAKAKCYNCCRNCRHFPSAAGRSKISELPPGQRQDYLDFRKQVSPLGLGWGPDFVRGQ